MNLFQTTQKGFALVGIKPCQSKQNDSLNLKILATLLSYILTVISYNVYLFCVASTFFEYTDNIYANSALTSSVICYIIAVAKMRKIGEVFADCEAVTVKSEWKLEVCFKFQINWNPRQLLWNLSIRSWLSRIDGNLCRSQRAYWKNLWHHLFHSGKSDSHLRRVPEILCKPFGLFHHRFGRWSSRIATANVVRLLLHCIVPFSIKDTTYAPFFT